MKNLPLKGAILFKGKRTATRQYADWLSEALGFPVFDLQKEQPNLAAYDLLVIGSAVYVGQYFIKSWLEQHWDAIRDKHLLFYTVSGTTPDHPDIQVYFANNLKPEMRERLSYFPMRGRLKMEEVGFLLRFFLKMAARSQKDPDARQRMAQGFDDVKRENIQPIVEAARQLAFADQALEVSS